MRKVLLTFLLALSLSFGTIFILGTTNGFSKEDPQINIEDPKYTYIRVMIEGKPWIIVLDKECRIIDTFPDECGGGGPMGPL